MPRKVFWLTLFLLLTCSIPAFGDVKVESDTIAGLNSGNSNNSWDTGFITDGNWALGPDFAFFLKDELEISQTDQEWLGTLDRCYLRYEQGPVRFNLGRQGVTWGIGWFFRPTDLITPLTPLAEEETRPGKDLAVLRWSTSPVTAVDFIGGEEVIAARYEWRIGPTNLRVLGVYQPGYIDTLGYDFQGGLAGLYGEGAYRWADPEASDQGRFTGLLGWQKVIGAGNQLYVEYYRNDLCKAGPELANLVAQNLNHEFFYTNQNYLAVGFQIPWDQLTTVAITGISSPDDGGMILEGIADLQLTDNLEVRGILMTLLGPENTEFWILGQDSRVGISLEVKYFF